VLQCRQHRVFESRVEHSNVERGAFESSVGVELASDFRMLRGRARLWNSDEFAGSQFRQHRVSSVERRELAFEYRPSRGRAR
jgi:hypothetical protein